MGVSIYYTASRLEPLTPREQAAIDAAVARHPLSMLLGQCGVTADAFDGEDFCIYSVDGNTEPGVILDGATKLPFCTENASWAAVQHWCRLLSDLRRSVPRAQWHVHVDDHDIPWNEKRQAFYPDN